MLSKLIHLLFLVGGMAFGRQLYFMLPNIGYLDSVQEGTSFLLVGMIVLGGVIGLLVAPVLVRFLSRVSRRPATGYRGISTSGLVVGLFGLIIGLLIALLLAPTLGQIPVIDVQLQIVSTVFLGLAGVLIALARKDDLLSLLSLHSRGSDRSASFLRVRRRPPLNDKVSYKILDTSVIIDGRIADICKTGFVEGVLVVPRFVLEELQHIADSSDVLKRNRGRRGLDILRAMQKDPHVVIQISDQDYDDLSEVDSKLVRMAVEMDAKIVTNDYNLNKVADLQGVRVLNVNELANSVKPVVLPGEEMVVHVIKDGKESGQGVAYLDDGTMIVVDGGKQFLGEHVDVLVTSVLQTAAGRMIFAKPKQAEERETRRNGRYTRYRSSRNGRDHRSNHAKMERVL